jgi:hypothetical protein
MPGIDTPISLLRTDKDVQAIHVADLDELIRLESEVLFAQVEAAVPARKDFAFVTSQVPPAEPRAAQRESQS